MEETKSPALGTSRWVSTTTDRLAAERGWAEGSSLEVFLLALVAAREEARQGLQRKVRDLRDDLDRLDKILRAESPLLNSLGELQQRPAAVEAAVGAFDAAGRALRIFLETFPPVS